MKMLLLSSNLQDTDEHSSSEMFEDFYAFINNYKKHNDELQLRRW